jgi:hypothetical protein
MMMMMMMMIATIIIIGVNKSSRIRQKHAARMSDEMRNFYIAHFVGMPERKRRL